MTVGTTPRVGPWDTTFTGAKYWPEDPRAGDFSLADIAHALANQCRFGGHCREFYSVAQHSVIVSNICAPADALWGLLHDASEAYLVDIPRPVKYSRGMERYTDIERAFMAAICEQYGLGTEMPTSVHWADEALLRTADTGLLGIRPWSPETAEREFIQRFAQLAPAAFVVTPRDGRWPREVVAAMNDSEDTRTDAEIWHDWYLTTRPDPAPAVSITVDEHVEAVNAACAETLRAWQHAILGVMPITTAAMDLSTPEGFARAVQVSFTQADPAPAAGVDDRAERVREGQAQVIEKVRTFAGHAPETYAGYGRAGVGAAMHALLIGLNNATYGTPPLDVTGPVGVTEKTMIALERTLSDITHGFCDDTEEVQLVRAHLRRLRTVSDGGSHG